MGFHAISSKMQKEGGYTFLEAGEPLSHAHNHRDARGDVCETWRCFGRRGHLQCPTPCQAAVIALGAAVLVSAVVLTTVSLRLLVAGGEADGAMVSLGYCGRSAQEARALGCVFDFFMGGFSRPACFNADLDQQYWRRYGGLLAFFRDAAGTAPMTADEVRAGDWAEMWLSGTYHYAHCAYMWEKHFRALAGGRRAFAMDSQTRSGKHIFHCTGFVGRPNATYFLDPVGTHIKQSWIHDCIYGPMSGSP